MSTGSVKIEPPPSMSRNRVGRWNLKPISCGSSRWKTDTSWRRNRRWLKLDASTAGSMNRSETITTRARCRIVSASSWSTSGSRDAPAGFASSRMSNMSRRWVGLRRGGSVRTMPSATQEMPTASPCWEAR
jgi:hypothetical protein